MPQGIIEIEPSFLGQLILLPEDYKTTSAYHDYTRGIVGIVVDHKDIPECNTPECTQLPRVKPTYRKVLVEATGDYKTELADIKIIP